MPVITAAEYPAARAALDVTLDATALPDSVLSQPVYVDAAEAELLRLDPDVATRTGDAQSAAKRAGALLLAALLAPAVPRVVRETMQDYAYQAEEVDWAQLATELRGRAQREVAGYLVHASTATRPTLFARASGTRGW